MKTLSFEQASKQVFNQATLQLKLLGRSFELDEESKRLYRLLTLYFTQNPEFESHFLESKDGKKIYYNLGKGILIAGSPGRSKTFSMVNVFNPILASQDKANSFKVIHAPSIQLAVSESGLSALKMQHTSIQLTDNILIDDLGCENFEVKHYGNNLAPMESYLTQRHRSFISSQRKIKTHATTNLSLTQLKEAYDYRVYSRLFEMFNIIIVSGSDLRIQFV